MKFVAFDIEIILLSKKHVVSIFTRLHQSCLVFKILQFEGHKKINQKIANLGLRCMSSVDLAVIQNLCFIFTIITKQI